MSCIFKSRHANSFNFSILLCAVLVFPPPLPAQTGDVRGVHDPVLIRDGGAFYMFSTGAGVPMRKSSNLFDWQLAGRVFSQKAPSWAIADVPGAFDVWAPDISYFNGCFQLYYSVSTFGKQHSVIGLATNVTLDPANSRYLWIDRGKVIESSPGGACDFNAIDPNFTLDAKGHPWLCFGSFWSGIKITPLDPSTGKPPAGAPPAIFPIAANPGSTAIEAPFLIYHGGYYYLFVSYDQCCQGTRSTYNLRVGRSREITGPYSDCAGRPMLDGGGTLLLASHGRVAGPGHCGLLRDQAGEFIAHHNYIGEGVSSALQIRPLHWSADGWPLAGEPIRRAPAPDAASSSTLSVSQYSNWLMGKTWMQRVGFGEPMRVQFFSNGRINNPNGGATWSIAPGGNLTLRWPDPRAPGGVWVDECILAPDGSYYVGRNQQHTDIRATPGAPPGGASTP